MNDREKLMKMKKQFSCNLVYLMMRDSISSNRICDQFSITPQTLSAWRRGKGLPSITRLPDLSQFFNVTMEEMLGPMQIRP